ncbi:MAG: O-methyltransferase [Chloroflexaceae bacterium]|nr:O-methyltransferase [Chloroflexaceae bacterium]
MNEELFHAVDQYIQDLFVPADPILEEIRQNARSAGLPAISVTANQGMLLYMLARLCRARRILEVGTLAGYSTIWMARALPHDGQLVSIEHHQLHAQIARANIARAGLSHIIEVREGSALEILPQIAEEGASSFDMVFLDADKPAMTDYLHWSLQLLRPGGLLVADNAIMKGNVVDAENTDAAVEGMRRFNEALAAHEQITSTILPMVGLKGYDGIAIGMVRD